jgi:hypothetical protein
VAERPIALPPVIQRGSAPLGLLLFICPKTSQQAPTGIATDLQSLSASWKAVLKVSCPHCGEIHDVSVREAYINGALRDLSISYVG